MGQGVRTIRSAWFVFALHYSVPTSFAYDENEVRFYALINSQEEVQGCPCPTPHPFVSHFLSKQPTTQCVNDMTIGFALLVKQNLPPSYMLLPPSPHEKGKALRTRLEPPSVCKQNGDCHVAFQRRRNLNPHCLLLSQKTTCQLDL